MDTILKQQAFFLGKIGFYDDFFEGNKPEHLTNDELIEQKIENEVAEDLKEDYFVINKVV